MNRLHLLWLIGLCSHCHSTTAPGTAQAPTPASVTTVVVSSTTPATSPDSLPYAGYLAGDIPLDTSLFAGPYLVGTLDDPSLVEASGLAPSRQNPGYFWTEEDSGNPNQIQLLDKSGRIAGRFTLTELVNRDWEDIAVGPGPVAGKNYIYLADIGDNKLRYPTKIIYRFPEPSLQGKSLPIQEDVQGIDAIQLQLPDGPQNAEAMLLDPATLDLYLLSKGDHSVLYWAPYPQSLSQPTRMQRQLGILFDKVTSAGVSPEGSEILIRTYGQLFYYKRGPGESILNALKQRPRRIPLANEPQGEAVGWAIDGSGYYTTSEKPDATPQAIYWYPRRH